MLKKTKGLIKNIVVYKYQLGFEKKMAKKI